MSILSKKLLTNFKTFNYQWIYR